MGNNTLLIITVIMLERYIKTVNGMVYVLLLEKMIAKVMKMSYIKMELGLRWMGL